MRARCASSMTLGAVLFALAPGCVDRFETPSDYLMESYLCDDDAEMAKFMADCLEEQNEGKECGGAVSFTGRLQGSHVTVDSYLARTDLFVAPHGAETSNLVRRLDVYGAGTYFKLSLVVQSVDTVVSATTSVEREFLIDSEAELAKSEIGDGLIDLGLRLTVAGESAELHALTGSGSLSMELDALDEMRGRFSGAFETEENRIEGCFRAFPTSTITEKNR